MLQLSQLVVSTLQVSKKSAGRVWRGGTAPRQARACPRRVNGKRNYTCARQWSGVKCLAGCSVSAALRLSDSRRGSVRGEALSVLGHAVR